MATAARADTSQPVVSQPVVSQSVTSQSVTLRTVTIEDAAAIQAIYAPYVANTVISFEATPPRVEEMVQRIQKTTSKFPWLVCVANEQAGRNESGRNQAASSQDSSRRYANSPSIAGYAYASLHRERAAYQWSVDVSVYVAPHFQRRSIGRGLYTALFDLLRAQGYVNAYAGITLPNAASVGIHTALGFEPVGVYKQVGYKFGAWHDVGWWCLRLTPPASDSEPLPPRAISDFVDTPLWSQAMQSGLGLIRG